MNQDSIVKIISISLKYQLYFINFSNTIQKKTLLQITNLYFKGIARRKKSVPPKLTRNKLNNPNKHFDAQKHT